MPARAFWQVVLRKELLVMARDARFVAALCAIMLVYGVALYQGWHEQRSAYADYERARAGVWDSWLNQGERNPHDAGHWGTFVFKPPHALRILDRGAADYMGQSLHLETHRRNDARHRIATESTSFLRLGGIGPGTIVLLLMPLLLLIMTHAAVIGERESGTSGLLRATGVTAASIHRGKVVGALVFTSAWLLPLLALTAALILNSSGSTTAVAAATGGAMLLVVVYCAVFVLLGVTLSAVARTSRQALAAGFALWGLVCVVLPRVAATVAEAAAPAPSAFEFRRMLEAERDHKWSVAYRARGNFRDVYARAEAQAMREQGVTEPHELLIDPFGLAIEETEEEGQRAYDSSIRRVVRSFEQQDALRRLFSMASPSVALSTALASLGETDLQAHLRFADSAEQYRRETMRRLNLDIAYNARREAARDISTTGFVRDFVRDSGFWATFGQYEPPARTARVGLAAIVPEAIALVIWLVAAAALSRAAIRRRWQQ